MKYVLGYFLIFEKYTEKFSHLLQIKSFSQKNCHFATCPVFVGAKTVALWWH